jgi:hypothetical protein
MVKNKSTISLPDCAYCGVLHFGTPIGKCPFQCERCNLDIREYGEQYGHKVCECPPLPPAVQPTIQPQYEIHIVGLSISIRLNQVQFDDLRRTLIEHERNGLRDGWSRVGSVSITELGQLEPVAQPTETK